MRIHLALYDSASISSQGSNWRWDATIAKEEVLSKFFYDVAMACRPASIESLGPNEIWGGIARLDSQWVAVFRFANGGRDSRGRPGRFLLMVALVSSEDASTFDLSPLISCPPFQSIADLAPSNCPIPTFALVDEVDAQRQSLQWADMEGIDKTGRQAFEKDVAPSDAYQRWSQLPADQGWICEIQRRKGSHAAKLRKMPIQGQQAVSIQQDEPAEVSKKSTQRVKAANPLPSRNRTGARKWTDRFLTFLTGVVFGILIGRTASLVFLRADSVLVEISPGDPPQTDESNLKQSTSSQ